MKKNLVGASEWRRHDEMAALVVEQWLNFGCVGDIFDRMRGGDCMFRPGDGDAAYFGGGLMMAAVTHSNYLGFRSAMAVGRFFHALSPMNVLPVANSFGMSN